MNQTNSTTEKILADLYVIDPALKQHESDVRRVVARLKNSHKEVPLDEAFVRRLRTDLVQMGAPIQSRRTITQTIDSFLSRFAGPQIRWALSGAFALFLVFLIPLGVVLEKTQGQVGSFSIKNFSFSSSEKQSIEFKPENAFGTLPLVPTSTPFISFVGSSTNSATSSLDTFSLDGSSTASLVDFSWPTAPTGSLGYDGSLTTLVQASTTPVLRRIVDGSADSQLSDLLKGMNFDLANLSSFSGLSLRNVEVSEDRPFGYTISVNADTGNITIGKNITRWLALSDSSAVPLSDKMAIGIANDFFNVHDIDLTNYGDPVATDSQNTSSIQVLFPLVINNQEVYNQDGTPYGISVSIDDQLQKVTAVYNITSQTYEASAYSLENNPTTLLDVIGATTTSVASSTDFSTVFHDPKQVLARYVVGTGTTSSELFVPALLFPVTRKSDTNNASSTFILPLVKDLLSGATSTDTY